MRIASVRIENFRCFKDETIVLDDYNCFVGRNGSGKSTILHALNVFFRQYRDTHTDLSRLTADDYHYNNTDQPIRITVTFRNLGAEAKTELGHYVRQEKLIVTAEATYSAEAGRAEVKQYGTRLVLNDFRPYFEAEKEGQSVASLSEIYAEIRRTYPSLPNVSTKKAMTPALRKYEEEHPEDCLLTPSEDQFYGASRGVNKLAPYIQWVFVSASKDVTEEADETKDSALGQLLERTVRSKIDFSLKVKELKESLESEYEKMLEAEQGTLSELSTALQSRLQAWAHPLVTAEVRWHQEAGKSVRIDEPSATIRLGEHGFISEIARFGHGLQRSYLLALLQELSALESESQPTLVMAIEEPELYQHPPQARYLSETLKELTLKNAQVLCCSHCPLFVPGDQFDTVRMVRDVGVPTESRVTRLEYQTLADDLKAVGQQHFTEAGMMAKLYPSLNPTISEMFFCARLILVEGIEDVAHLTAYIELSGMSGEYRRWGCHIVPVGGKRALIKPLAIAKRLRLPVYVMFDADTTVVERCQVEQHKKENLTLQRLLEVPEPIDWPSENVQGINYQIWSENIGTVVKNGLGDVWVGAEQQAAERYGYPGGLEKNPIAIAYAHELVWDGGAKCSELLAVVERIMDWACTDERDKLVELNRAHSE